MSDVTVWKATLDDLEVVSDALYEAGLDEVVTAWAVSDSTDQEISEFMAGFREEHVAPAIRDNEVLAAKDASGEVLGVALWVDAVGRQEFIDKTKELHAAAEATGNRILDRLALVNEKLSVLHPKYPHAFLHGIAVLPSHRGKGVGSVIIDHKLSQVDEAGKTAYLEASTRRSQALYSRLGFAPLGELVGLPHGGPQIQPMLRPASR